MSAAVLLLFAYQNLGSVVHAGRLEVEKPITEVGDRAKRPLVVNLGIAKSGTTSLFKYFHCSGWKAVHDIKCRGICDERRCKNLSCGDQLQRFILSTPLCDETETSPLVRPCYSHGTEQSENFFVQHFHEYTGPFDVYAEMNNAVNCNFPQVDLLFDIIERLSGACFILTSRPVEHWLDSVRRFRIHGITLLERLLDKCSLAPQYAQNETGLAAWYVMHLKRARAALAKVHCALEVEIESPDAGARLAELFPGTNSSCWGHANRNKHVPSQVVELSNVAAATSGLLAANRTTDRYGEKIRRRTQREDSSLHLDGPRHFYATLTSAAEQKVMRKRKR